MKTGSLELEYISASNSHHLSGIPAIQLISRQRMEKVMVKTKTPASSRELILKSLSRRIIQPRNAKHYQGDQFLRNDLYPVG